MQRPGFDTLACVNPACQRLRLTGQDNLTVRKVYGQDHIRLLRCRTCGEECSERRGTALFHTTVPEERAASIIDHRGEGCGVRATARLVHVSKDTVARRLRMAGRHAERVHDDRVRDVTPRAVEFDEQWSFVKKSRSGAQWQSVQRQATYGTIRRWRRTANGLGRSSSANGPKRKPGPWCPMPKHVSVRGICRPASPMPMRARSRRSAQPLAVALCPRTPAAPAGLVVPSSAGPKAWRMGRGRNSRKGEGSSGWPCGSCMAKHG